MDFSLVLSSNNIKLSPIGIDTMQVNITKLCNQACQHCHVDASPTRTEQMNLQTVDRCLEVLKKNHEIQKLDITGGAPELNPHFDYFVKEARKLQKHVIVRHNLTVTLDGNPITGESKQYLPRFFAEQQVEVISSLPFHQKYFTDKQRGHGVFEKSMESLKLLNGEGYGQNNSELILNLVYNPVGFYLPPEQMQLEQDYKQELFEKHGIVFNHLYTIANMPIHRFKDHLVRAGAYDDYMDKLVKAFNPDAARGVMCRNMMSVGYDGTLYDCDFNQMLEMKMNHSAPQTIFDFDFEKLLGREISFGSHCLGCTAGSGSSCGGSTT